jgi:putative hydrolase of the HAD superfamily
MAILFDIDGTLLDHSSAQRSGAVALHARITDGGDLNSFLSSWRVALERHYARYLAGEISYTDQQRARVREVVGGSLTNTEVDRLFAVYLAVYEDAWRLYPDVWPCMEQLSNTRLGIISNGNAAQQRAKLQQTGIIDHFEIVLVSEECGYAKPDAETFLQACRLLGNSPDDVTYVGDHYEVDAVGARRAGLNGIWLDRQGCRSPRHEPPIITSLEQLPRSCLRS